MALRSDNSINSRISGKNSNLNNLTGKKSTENEQQKAIRVKMTGG